MAGFIYKIRNRRQKDHVDDVPGGERPRYDTDSGGSFAPAGSPSPELMRPTAGKRRELPSYPSGKGLRRGAPKLGYASPDETASEPVNASEGAPKPYSYAQPKSGALPKEAPAETGNGSDSAADSGETEYDTSAAISDFYNKLYNKLRAYGIADIPSFSELYGLFESFLRPAIDAAIAQRQKTGRANKAELDADAYARGMGGSSYLSSMKARENDNAAADVAALEGKYSASMAEYLYKAVETMQKIESELAKTRMTIAAARASTGRSGRKSSKGKSNKTETPSGQGSRMPYGHNKNGSYFDGAWYDGDFSYLDKDYTYVDYARYLNGLSPSERYLFFTSNNREWRIRRWQVQYNLPQVDYWDLYDRFMPHQTTGGGEESMHVQGGTVWHLL